MGSTMSNTTHSVVPGPPRVREQAREAATLMAFSAATSAALAGALVLITGLGR